MRLGKALATGVAQEQPRVAEAAEEESQLVERIDELEPAVEEVPVAR
jgi:hypothetical protein